MQVNIRKGNAANNLALTYILKNQHIILLVQKPWIRVNLDKQLLKKHNGF